ncbi:MAG: hypothetical protein HY716_08850 [Planctomycetes bacterium]|nr:hypothetical protein [Planctomycetota bacterium]
MKPPLPWTTAERTSYRGTSTHADVLDFLAHVARRTRLLRLETLGRSAEGRPIPAAIVSRSRAFTPALADRNELLKILVIANIHAGEVEGKEACLMLARDLTLRRVPAWLRKCVLILVPNYNPDGNDRISPDNRRLDLDKLDGQMGPEGGVGTRYTGAGINLNRDYTKQEAIESVLLSRAFGRWRPHLVIDCHTTNGSLHGYDLTYDTAHTLESAPREPILFVRDHLLPEVSRRLRRRTGFRTFFYGNYRDPNDPRQGWETYSPLPRYGSHYRGLTGRMDVLLEAYSYIPFERRIAVTYEMLLEIFRFAAQRSERIRSIVERAERETVERGRNPSPIDLVGINYGITRPGPGRDVTIDYSAQPFPGSVQILGWDRKTLEGRRLERGKRVPYRAPFYGWFAPTRWVKRPFAYVVPRLLVPRLLAHNLIVERLARSVEAEVERYILLDLRATKSPDVGSRARRETVLWTRSETLSRRLAKGAYLVRTAQPLAHVAIYLLEPESDDGLARWGFLDRRLRAGGEFPVLRLNGPAPLPTQRIVR